MLKSYGIHAAQDVAIAANDLRRAIRDLRNDETYPDHVGLATLASVADALAEGTDRYWWSIRPLVDAETDNGNPLSPPDTRAGVDEDSQAPSEPYERH